MRTETKTRWNRVLSAFLAALVLLTVVIPAGTQEAYAATVVSTPTVGVNGRVLTSYQAGDTSDWIEIARNDGYSLLLRKDVLPVGWQAYTVSGTNNVYSTSNVRNVVNNWFNNTLSSTSRLRSYSSTHNALTELGGFASLGGISKPTGVLAKSGNDVAFLLSFGEAANYCSWQYATSTSTWKASSDLARANFNKLTPLDSKAMQDFWWLRSPGMSYYTACSVGTHTAQMGNIVWASSSTNFKGYDYVRPALWVNAGIWGPDIATVNVRHLDADTGAVLGSNTFTIPAGNYGYYGPNSYTGYQAGYLAPYSDAPQGTIALGQVKNVTWLYKKAPAAQATVIVRHLDAASGAVLGGNTFTIPAGNYGYYGPNDYPGYQPGVLASYSDPPQGTIGAGELKTVTWLYSRVVVASATIIVMHLDLTTYTTFEVETLTVPAGPYGPIQPKSYAGYEPGVPVLGSAPVTGTIGANETILIIFGYNKSGFTVVVQHRDSSTKALLTQETHQLPLGVYGPYTAYTNIQGYRPGYWDTTSASPVGVVSQSGQTITIVFLYDRYIE